MDMEQFQGTNFHIQVKKIHQLKIGRIDQYTLEVMLDISVIKSFFKNKELYLGARNTKVEGITIANSPFHSIHLVSKYDPSKPTEMRWLKIFTWRGNGDGIGSHANDLVEDCFIRTQDDSLYVTGRAMRR